jgi:hypothetical protein
MKKTVGTKIPGRLELVWAWAVEHWSWCLAAAAAVLFTASVVAYFPGFMSNDSISQLGQAVHPVTLNDWHPPIMTALWWTMLHLPFHAVGYMLLLQLLLLWSALAIAACYVYKVTGSKKLSVLPLLLGIAPCVINISGDIWKDDQLAFAALLGSVLLLCARHTRIRLRYRYTAIAVAALLFVYASAVRYNSLPALLPLIFLLEWPVKYLTNRFRVVLAIILVVGAFGSSSIIGFMHPIHSANPSGSIMLDDVVHMYPVSELRTMSIPQPLKGSLISVEKYCSPASTDVDYTDRCASAGEFTVFFTTDYKELRSLYVHGIVKHPLRYIRYRSMTFMRFLNPTPAESFVWWYGIQPNPYGVSFTPNHLTGFMKGYIDFSFSNLGILYKPYFWLLAGAALCILTIRRRSHYKHAAEVVALTLSGLLYIIAYFPMVIGYDYRYVYWSVLSISLAAILCLADSRAVTKRQSKRARNRRQGVYVKAVAAHRLS